MQINVKQIRQAIKKDKEKKDRLKRLINWNTIDGARLIKVFMLIKTPDLMRDFLEDLLTKYELEQGIKRFTTARLIMMGTPYKFISLETGLSSKAIAKISKKLVNKKGGFQIMMKKLYPGGIKPF